MARAICDCSLKSDAGVTPVDRSVYRRLHLEGRHLIEGWFCRSWEQRDVEGEAVFEPFIYAWIAFNGWASCVTGQDQDAQYLRSIIHDAELNGLFTSLVQSAESNLSKSL
jgi:hypothetical protein